MRVLFVAPHLPGPGSGGRTRVRNHMRIASAHHEVKIVAFRQHDQEPTDSPFDTVVVEAPPSSPRPGGALGALRFYGERLGRAPDFVRWVRSSQMARAIADACASFRPDVVQFEHEEMAQYMDVVPRGIARTWDMHDAASLWFERLVAEQDTRKGALLARAQLRRVRAYEQRYARAADLVFIASPAERAHIFTLTGIEPVVIENGVDPDYFAPIGEVAEESERVVFVGPMTYSANLEGLRWFVRDVLPRLRDARPSVRVESVGVPGDHVLEGVEMLGRVDDVRPYLARAPVSIVPVRIGSGTRFKILEALSMERAVVSTTLGAEGLGVSDGEHLLLADEAAVFADAIARLLGDPALRARLGRAGRSFVVGRYAWGPLVARMEAAWEGAVRRASTR
jgi:glycosyltransferase involved in cell wall biosynthesis